MMTILSGTTDFALVRAQFKDAETGTDTQRSITHVNYDVIIRIVAFYAYCSIRIGELTSQNLWPRYVRHFVGITWHDVWS